MQIVSQHRGAVRECVSELADGNGRVWQSAIGKQSVAGNVALDKLGLDGDAQADLVNHGGPDKAVCCYPAAHYPIWRQELGMSAAAFPFGAFGENWTWDGSSEHDVCIGDVYSVSDAVVQISHPRGPCWKVGRLWKRTSFPGEMIDTGRTGWYLRVLQPGSVAVGDKFTLAERLWPQWSVASVNHAFYEEKSNKSLAADLAELSLLAEAWRGAFRKRAVL